MIISKITVAQAEKPKCDDVLNACLNYAKTLEVERDFLQERIKRQNEIINDLEEKQPNQPWYFWVLIGAAGGIVLQGVR